MLIQYNKSALGRTTEPLVVLIMPFYIIIDSQIILDSQFAHKIQYFWYHLSIANGMMNCEERHPLLMECSITFLVCIQHIEGAFDRITETLVGLTMPSSAGVDFSIAQKMPDFWYPLSTYSK